jgi:WD40 repeat protein
MTKEMRIVIALLILFAFPVNQAYTQETANSKILWTADWSPDGRYIAVGGNSDTLKIYHSEDLQLFKSYAIKSTITCVKWHPFENILAIGTQVPNSKVFILEIKTDKTVDLEGISTDGARGIDWNYSGDYLAVADNDGQTSVFDKAGKKIRSIQQENTKSLTSVDWHPGKNIFITVGDKIRIYDFDGTLIKSIIHRQEDVLLLCVAWHNSGSFFVTGDYGDNQLDYKPLLQFWNSDGELLKSIALSKGEYRNIDWNSKGTRLASASDALRIWDKDGNLVSEGNPTDYLWGVSWNGKGDRIVTSGSDQKVIVWDSKARMRIIRE